MFDHSLLHPTITDSELVTGCQLALLYHVASVCIKSYAVKLAMEASQALADGATEINMVVNIGVYNYAGAMDLDLHLMCHECLPSVQVKAARGIRPLDDLIRVKSYGVSRVGATVTGPILTEAKDKGYK